MLLDKPCNIKSVNKLINKPINKPINNHMNENLIKTKKVTFHFMIDVILIPSLEEYKKSNLIPQLWWNQESYMYFKNSAREEIFECMEKNKGITIKDATQILYQSLESLESLEKLYNSHESI
jgi:hypothetical protein